MEVAQVIEMTVPRTSTLDRLVENNDMYELFGRENQQDLSVGKIYICIILDVKSKGFERGPSM